jgi:hypothetical protein
MLMDSGWILGLLDTYHDELAALSQRVRERYWRMCARGDGKHGRPTGTVLHENACRPLDPERFEPDLETRRRQQPPIRTGTSS